MSKYSVTHQIAVLIDLNFIQKLHINNLVYTSDANINSKLDIVCYVTVFIKEIGVPQVLPD